jgi:hypothetical protein
MPMMSSGLLAGGGPASYPLAMTGGSGKSGDPRRSERLRAALRDNLKRRKAQLKARAQAGAKAVEHDSAEIAPHKPKG